VSITILLKNAHRIAGRSASVAALAALALAVGACDLGGRDRLPFLDSGLDAGPPDAGEDAGTAPLDGGVDAGFRDGDAGAWVDDPVVVPGPCDNDCAYDYNLTSIESGDPYFGSMYGRASFEVWPGDDGDTAVARELQKSAFFIVEESSSGYRQRAIQNLVLDADTHELVSGDALVSDSYGNSLYWDSGYGFETLKYYTFSYDRTAGELSYAVESAGRRWERTLAAPDPPVVMLNHREYPIETYGFHSPLTAMLLGERYDWAAGGAQRVPIFSPEMERIDAVELVEGDEPETLVLRFPIDTAKPPRESWEIAAEYETNDVPIRYEYGVPVYMGSRDHVEWTAVYVPKLEVNVPLPPDDPIPLELPAVPIDGEPVTAASGGATLHGVVDAPAGPGLHAAVVMIPGWEYMTRRGEVGAIDLYAQLAQRLVEGGAVAARFDARGAEEGGIAFAEATIDELVADAQAAVAAVQARDDVDPSRVFLLTTGAGAHVAAGVAVAAEVELAGIVLVAPFGRPYEDAVQPLNDRYMASALASEPCWNGREDLLESIFESLADGSYEGDAYLGHTVAAWQSLFPLDLVASPVALPPTLILYGAEDHLVPLELVDELAIALGGGEPPDGGADEDAGAGGGLTDVTTAILPGLTHALTPGTAAGMWPEHGGAEAVDDGAVAAMTDWLAAIAGGL
jgi:acetyl esterase/lipase